MNRRYFILKATVAAMSAVGIPKIGIGAIDPAFKSSKVAAVGLGSTRISWKLVGGRYYTKRDNGRWRKTSPKEHRRIVQKVKEFKASPNPCWDKITSI